MKSLFVKYIKLKDFFFLKSNLAASLIRHKKNVCINIFKKEK